jgi:hypothetical protein
MIDEQQNMRHQEALTLNAMVTRNCPSAEFSAVCLELPKEIWAKALLKKKGGVSDTGQIIAKIKGKFVKTNPLATTKRSARKKSVVSNELYVGYNEDAFQAAVAEPKIEHVRWRPKR